MRRVQSKQKINKNNIPQNIRTQTYVGSEKKHKLEQNIFL